MSEFFVITLVLVWYAIGVLGFIYWWTKDSDLTINEIPIVFLMGFLGLLTWWL